MQFNIGFDMARQRRRSRELIIRFIPLFILVDILDVVRCIPFIHESRTIIIGEIIMVIFLIYSGYYAWLYLFCTNKQTENLMKNVA